MLNCLRGAVDRGGTRQKVGWIKWMVPRWMTRCVMTVARNNVGQNLGKARSHRESQSAVRATSKGVGDLARWKEEALWDIIIISGPRVRAQRKRADPYRRHQSRIYPSYPQRAGLSPDLASGRKSRISRHFLE